MRRGRTLIELFEARGLRGRDEYERTVAALASTRLLRDALSTLRVTDATAMTAVLNEKLLLVRGRPVPCLSNLYAMVSVSDDRRELDGDSSIQQAVESLGEALLLGGFRHLLLVEARPYVVRCLLEYMDSRVEVRPVGKLPVHELAASGGAKIGFVWGHTPNQVWSRLRANTIA